MRSNAENLVRRLLVPPNDPTAAAAFAAHVAGDNATAVRLIDDAIASDPDPAFSWALRGDALAALGRRVDAADAFEKAIERVEASEPDRMSLAVILYSNQPEVAADARRAGFKWAQTVRMIAESAAEPKTGGARATWTPPIRTARPAAPSAPPPPSVAPRVALSLALAVAALLLIAMTWQGC